MRGNGQSDKATEKSDNLAFYTSIRPCLHFMQAWRIDMTAQFSAAEYDAETGWLSK